MATSALIGALRATLSLDTAAFEKGADKATRQLRGIEKNTASTSKGLRTLTTAARSAGAALVAAFSIRAVIGTLADFEQQMSTVRGITKANEVQFKALRLEAQRLGATTRFSASQAAEGMVFLSRAGFNVREVLAATEGTLKLAQAGALDLGRAADIASNILTGFRLNVDQTGRIVDVLALAANNANTNVEQLGDGMKFVAPVAAGLGVSVEDATAAVAALSDAGLQGSLAGTGLRRVLSELESPSKKTRDILTSLGVSTDQVKISQVGLVEALTRLRDAGVDTGNALEIFGDRGGPAFEVLSSSIPKVLEMRDRLGEAAGTADELAAVMDDNLNGALLAVKSAAEAVLLALGDSGGTSGLRGVLEGLASVLRLVAGNIEILTALLGVLAAVVVGRLVTSFAAAATAALAGKTAMDAFTLSSKRLLALLGGPVGIALIAVGAAFQFLQSNVEANSEASATYQKLESDATDVRERAEAAALELATATGEAAKAAKENAARVREETQALYDNAQAALAAAKAKAQAAVTRARESGLFGGGFLSNVALGGLTFFGAGPGPELQKAAADLKAAQSAFDEANAALAAFNKPRLGGGGGRGGAAAVGELSDAAKKLRDNIESVRDELADLAPEVERAFDTRQLPQSLETADQLRQRIEDITDKARKAGVPMTQFAGTIATLRARIEELELQGLADEADAFSRTVAETANSVTRLEIGALTPLDQRLADVDDRYNSLRQSIEDQIEENRVLAVANEDAARTMADLLALLGRLDEAHRNAADAARSQYEAEQALRDLAADQAAQRIGADIGDLRRAGGGAGLFTREQLALRQTDERLQAERIDALIQLRELENQLDEARLQGDVREAARLAGIIDLQQDYYDLILQTSAEQIVSAERLQSAFEDFTTGLADELFDMLRTFEFSLRGVTDLFLQLLNDIFLRPAVDSISGSIGGFLSGIFAGGFATGGVIPRGQFGIVGEKGPEPIFAADAPLRVLPTDVLAGAGGMTFNINVNGAMSDRDARRTGNQIGAAAARTFANVRKAGIAG